MLVIPCPYCGDREETEFTYGSEAHVERPKEPDSLSDEAWAEYVFMCANTKGIFLERWVHTHGCRRWFNVARDTLTNKIHAVYKMGEKPPRLPKTDYV
jgi:sarcosine oxidase subunit delta